MRDLDPIFDAWVARAGAADIAEVARKHGAALKKATSIEFVGPCPNCGGTDRFSINTKLKVWNCRGAEGGKGSIDLIKHIKACSFLEACELITGEPRPEHARQETEAERKARERKMKDIREAAERNARQEARAAEFRAKKDAEAVEALLARAVPIQGTHGEAYLREGRGIVAPKIMLLDVMFVPSVEYWGFTDAEATAVTHLASLPAMVSVIRRFGETARIGIHITYLDPAEPKKWTPIGDLKRNKAKKARKNGVKTITGGMVRLGMISETLVIGEGIETCLSARQLDLVPEASFASAMSLGNLSGSSTGTLTHPTMRTVYPNGKPDFDRPGVVLSRDVERVVILGDGDSNPLVTRGHVLTAVNRFEAEGRRVDVLFAPEGMDWNDVLRERAKVREATP